MARPALVFARLEQEDQRLKKHYSRWMDIVRSLELDSFILTKLTKPSVPINLVGPQVSLPLLWVPASMGFSFSLCVIRRHSLRALLWADGARRREVEEALRPLDGHRTVTTARIVHID